MTYTYRTNGVCSKQMELTIDDDGIIRNLEIEAGCNGNLQGLSRLVKGRDAKEIASLLRGVRCGNKNTSCPDQLARAIEKALE